MLTQRQETAQALADQLHRLGAWCVSPLPLAEGSKLRFDVLNDQRDAIIAKLISWGWYPRPCGSSVRIAPAGTGNLPQPAMSYEIALPKTTAATPTQTHHGELVDLAQKAKRKLHAY